MNNSLINRNTTVLVLVILILGFIYINLENNHSMTGGAVDCESFIPIVEKLIANDSLYSYTIGSTPGFIIYIILILILIFLGFNFVKYEITYSGSPVIPGTGYTMLDWAKGAFYKFYTVRNDMYFYKDTNAPGASGITTKQDEEQFTGLIEKLRSPAYKDTVHNFCEKIQPCGKVTPCACAGAIACQSNPSNILPFTNVDVEHFASSNPAQKALSLKQKHAKKFFGIIPKCCCVHRQKFIKADTPGKKIGDANPNYYTGDQAEEIGCGTGTRTVAGINTVLNSPGVNADGSIAPANPEDECKDVDCSNEPPYAQLLVDVFDGKGGINQVYLNSAKTIISNIIQNTPAADIATAFQNSTYNSGPSASLMGSLFSVTNLLSSPGISRNNLSSPTAIWSSPYNTILQTEVVANTTFDPATNIATMPPPPEKAANGPSGFTSKLSKGAKKIKKNKK